MNAQAVPRERLADYLGRRRVSDEWFQVTQRRIDLFAEATLDRQFIHVDPERASETPFGSTIATRSPRPTPAACRASPVRADSARRPP